MKSTLLKFILRTNKNLKTVNFLVKVSNKLRRKFNREKITKFGVGT